MLSFPFRFAPPFSALGLHSCPCRPLGGSPVAGPSASYTRLYEVEYLDFHKAELEANAATENIFAHIDGEGIQFMHLDTISNHRVNGE